jgi:hypothetical protein
LIDNFKGKDVQFLTLNMDENPGLIESFLAEHHLSLNVLPAYNYVTDTLKVLGIPQNWIVDPQGVVKLKGIGYESAEKWEAGMAEAIEKVRSGAMNDSRNSDVNQPR